MIERRSLIGAAAATVALATCPAFGSTRIEINEPVAIDATPSTLQAAIDLVADTLIVNNAEVMIRLAAGTYPLTMLRQWVGSGSPYTASQLTANFPKIMGDPNNPGSYIFSQGIVAVSVNSPWLIDGITTNAPQGYGIYADYDSKIYVGSVNHGAGIANLFASWGSKIELVRGGYHRVIGHSTSLARAQRGGAVLVQGGGVPAPQINLSSGSIDFVAMQDTGGIIDFLAAQFASGWFPARRIQAADLAMVIGL